MRRSHRLSHLLERSVRLGQAALTVRRLVWLSRLPSADRLDNFAYRTIAFALPVVDLRGDRRRDLGGERLGPLLGWDPADLASSRG